MGRPIHVDDALGDAQRRIEDATRTWSILLQCLTGARGDAQIKAAKFLLADALASLRNSERELARVKATNTGP